MYIINPTRKHSYSRPLNIFLDTHNSEIKESKLSVIYKSKNSFFKQSLFDINIPIVKSNSDGNEFNFI